MIENLLIRNENIQHVFEWYCEGLFMVNRKYQRKLVWTLEEKQKFIESIYLDYPVPLFLLANMDGKYEIIDGMQRLEAIFSFILGDYPIKIDNIDYYFDSNTMARTKFMLDDNENYPKNKLLSRDACVKIANYQLPLSITKYDDKNVEEIFRRINSTGRQLSSQDLRQAGAVGEFSDLVRKISTYIRRDTSDDIIELSKMRKISLSNRKLKYGIDIKNIFWVKQNIITKENMRISRDEETIAYILTYILLGDSIQPTATNLDIIYGYNEDTENITNKIITKIESIGSKEIYDNFTKVFDIVQDIIGSSKIDFQKLIFQNQRAHSKPRCFQVIFLAFYKLIIEENCYIEKNKKNDLIESLKGIGTNHLSSIQRNWKADTRENYINSIKGIIKKYFTKSTLKDNTQNPSVDNWIGKIENILSQSKIEQPLYDFKIGLYNIQNNNFNQEGLHKIIKTLTSMANLGKNCCGFVLIGIADNEHSANKYSNKYNIKYQKFNDFFITGVEGECNYNKITLDHYFNKIKNFIENEPIDDDIKSTISNEMRLVNYYDSSILVLSLQSDKPVRYDKKYYERKGNSVEEIETESLLYLRERFK